MLQCQNSKHLIDETECVENPRPWQSSANKLLYAAHTARDTCLVAQTSASEDY